MIFLFITILLSSLISVIKGNYHEIVIFGPIYGFETYCLIGNNRQPKYAFFDMNSALSVMCTNKIDSNQLSSSMVLKDETVNYLGRKGRHGTDRLLFGPTIDMPSFSFVFIHQQTDEEELKSTIALGYGTTSFLDQLKNANLIQQRKFSFFNNTLYLNDFENVFTTHRITANNKCKTISSVEPSWGCKLSGVLLGNYHFNTKDNEGNLVYYNEMNYIQLSTVASFDINEFFIVAPYRMAKFFEVNYFGHFFIEEACAMRVTEDGGQIDFKCNEKVIPLLNNINLIFDDKTSVILTPKELFAGDFNNFAIVFRKNITSTWIIGKMITVEHSPIFDMEDKSITFPINFSSATITMKRVFGLKVNLFGGIICSVSAGIILLIWIYFNIIKKSEKE